MVPSPAKSQKIVAQCDKASEVVSNFKETADLAEEYAIQLLQLYKIYRDEVSLPDDKRKFEDAQQLVKKFIDKYNEVIVPYVQGVPETIEANAKCEGSFHCK